MQDRDDTAEDEEAHARLAGVTEAFARSETEFDHEDAEGSLEGGGEERLHVGELVRATGAPDEESA